MMTEIVYYSFLLWIQLSNFVIIKLFIDCDEIWPLCVVML